MQARSGQRTNSASGGAFDIRVLAFSGPPARTLRALQEIFGVDAATAQRIVDSVPGIVRRAAPAAEAQSYVAALQSIGAQVTLEASNPAGAGRAQPPSPSRNPLPLGGGGADPDAWPELESVLSDPSAPRPANRAPSSDLEFDVLSSDDLVDMSPLPGGELESFEPVLRRADETPGGPGLGEPAGVGEPRAIADSPAPLQRKTTRTMRREELELDTGGSSNLLDVDPVARVRAAAGQPEPSPPEGEARVGNRTLTGLAKPTAGAAPGPGARTQTGKAAVIKHPDKLARPPKWRALLSLLAACAAFALGVTFDNTILFGNATTFSVVAHGLALHQLGFGLWGLWR